MEALASEWVRRECGEVFMPPFLHEGRFLLTFQSQVLLDWVVPLKVLGCFHFDLLRGARPVNQGFECTVGFEVVWGVVASKSLVEVSYDLEAGGAAVFLVKDFLFEPQWVGYRKFAGDFGALNHTF